MATTDEVGFLSVDYFIRALTLVWDQIAAFTVFLRCQFVRCKYMVLIGTLHLVDLCFEFQRLYCP